VVAKVRVRQQFKVKQGVGNVGVPIIEGNVKSIKLGLVRKRINQNGRNHRPNIMYMLQ